MPNSAIQLRIAEVHSGGTNWTSCFVTDQFTPQASTTMRNRPTAARGDREFISKSLKQSGPADSMPVGTRKSARLERNKVPVSESMISALIDLKRTGDEGLVAQLTSQLRSLIATGRLGKGRALPASRRLAIDLGVSRNTVTYAFEQLAAEGYLEASHGRRPVVAVDGGERIGEAAAIRSGVRPRQAAALALGFEARAGRLADVLSGSAKTVASGARRFQGVSE